MHFALATSLPLVYVYTKPIACDEADNLKGILYLLFIMHILSGILSIISASLKAAKVYEMAKVCEILRLPMYIGLIFVCQFEMLYELSTPHEKEECGDLFRFSSIWIRLEVMIFYFYILTAIIFILLANISGFMATKEMLAPGQPSKRNQYDFLDYSKNEQIQFCLSSCEVILTAYVLYEGEVL